jgi:hypothetical protein
MFLIIMARPRTPKIKVLAAAALRAEGWSLKQIHAHLRVPLSTLARSLKDMEGKYIITRATFLREKLTPAERAELPRYLPHPDMMDELRAFTETHDVEMPDIRVLSTPTRATTARAWAERLKQFGSEAAPYLHGLLRQARICGVSWGETVMSVVESLPAALPGAPTRRRAITFVPVVGDVIEKEPTKASASNLAERLDERMNGDYQHAHSSSLRAVPAVISPDHNATNAEAIREFVNRGAGFRKVFGTPKQGSGPVPLIDRLEMLLTSVGPVDRPLGWLGAGLLNAVGLPRAQMKDLIVGDVSGVLLRRQKGGEEYASRFDRIRACWTGIREKHIDACQQRARRSGKPGVVVVALGATKAPTVAELIRRGLCRHIFVDQELFDAMSKMLASDRGVR